MAAEDSQRGEEILPRLFQIDEAFEFQAPKFYDFMEEETEEESRAAELFFERGLSYAPSPFMARIRNERSVQPESMPMFEDADQIESEAKAAYASHSNSTESHSSEPGNSSAVESSHQEPQQQRSEGTDPAKQISEEKPTEDNRGHHQDKNSLSSTNPSKIKEAMANPSSAPPATQEACTPVAPTVSSRKPLLPSNVKNPTAKKIASLIKNPSGLKSKNASVDIVQENQAIKRQKLEGGRSRQILNVKTQVFPHKSKLGLNNDTGLGSSAMKCGTERKKNDPSQRKVYVREQVNANPFVSAAELVKKFQSDTRKIQLPVNNKSLSRDDGTCIVQKRPALKLTHPKEPELHTAQRARPTKMKSTAELEEEMLANMPTFKARPVNKKILEAPTLTAPARTAPHLPEFQEFHLKTMERAAQQAGITASSSSSAADSSSQNYDKPPKLTEPQAPHLETSLRARPTIIKSSQELEQEELEKVPKFKARPLNKKIFESKGTFGLFRNPKPQITIPQEFHFATDERLPPAKAVVDLFDKLSLHSEPCREQKLPRITTPNPFHLHTEERGMEKERRLAEELHQKEMEDERARIPKANPYPYTTDIPVIPPKPEPKACTKPEAFQLASLVRHEEEMQRKQEEKERLEKEQARMRMFKAQPILKEDPIPLPEKPRRPLTEVQEFVLHADHRAGERAEFDKKIVEKEMMYKRYREEFEMNQKIEEEKEVKQMRRTMVPHARPVPSFANPFVPLRSSKEPTLGKSPKLHLLHRKERRRIGSAAAGQMR